MLRKFVWMILICAVSSPALAQERAVGADGGVFVFAHRTTRHVRYSDYTTFNQMVDEVATVLEEGRVLIKKDPDRGMVRTEEEMSQSSILNLARIAGAAYVLMINVDRPVTKWIEVELKCYDIEGRLLWSEKASDVGGLTGKKAPAKTREKLRKLLTPRLGGEGLPVVKAAIG